MYPKYEEDEALNSKMVIIFDRGLTQTFFATCLLSITVEEQRIPEVSQGINIHELHEVV